MENSCCSQSITQNWANARLCWCPPSCNDEMPAQSLGLAETLVYLALLGCIWITPQTPPKPPHRVLHTLQIQPKQGKAALHLSSHEVANAGTAIWLHFSISTVKAAETSKQLQKISLLHRAFPVNFWSTLFKWVTSDIFVHIQAEHSVTGHCIMPGLLGLLAADDYCISHCFEYLCLWLTLSFTPGWMTDSSLPLGIR